MPTPSTANEFLDLVRKSGVLDEEAFAREFPNPDGLPHDAQRCATALTQAGLLTPFQTRCLLAGKFVGLVIGPYRLLDQIGQGGMGAVYKAEHIELKRVAAVKVLPPDKAENQLALQRFLREARSAAALDHPNIVRLFDVGQGAGVHYLVMEFVEGMTLDKLVERTGPLHFPTAAHYVAQAAAGLHHAHDKGFVHRDIKPGNLMVAKDGTVKVLDMGLARALGEERDKLTERLDSAAVVGTVDYIAPEQSLNQPVDHRADIYSLGATFFALVAGRPPFEGNATQKLMQHQVREAPRLSALRPVPEGLADVASKMLAKKPGDRYQSMAEVVDALAPWLPDAPSAFALEVGAAGTGPISAVTARTVVGATTRRITGATGTIWAQTDPRIQTRGRRWPLIAGVAAALVVLVGGGVYWAVGGSGKPARAAGVDSGRPPLVAAPVRLTGWDDGAERLAVSPDGRTLVTCGMNGKIGVWDLTRQRLFGELTGHTRTVWHAWFSPDGKQVVTASKDGTVRAWDLVSLAELWVYEQPGAEAWTAAFSPDGSRVVATFTGSSNRNNKVVALDAATGRPLFSRKLSASHGIAMLPDGRTAALTTMKPDAVVLWDYRSGELRREFPMADGDVESRAIAASPDGRTLAVGGGGWRSGGTGFLILLDADTGEERARFSAPDPLQAVNFIRFSPSGRYLVTSGYGARARVWDVSGNQVDAFDHDTDPVNLAAAAFVPGGRAVVSGSKDGSLWVWPVKDPAYQE